MTLDSSRPLVLVGAGKMGGAMLDGWISSGLEASAITVIDPVPSDDMKALFLDAGIRHETSAPENLTAGILVVAIKPQMMDKVLPGLRSLVDPSTVVVSIAAGTTIAALAEGTGAAKIVRAMPNTPAQVGRGMTAAVGNSAVTDADVTVVTELLSAIGHVVWLDDEAKMDAVTAVSGSGPAYVFHLVEALAEAGRSAGLDAETAMVLARQTVTGAGELLHQSELEASTLRENVTSPGGTTAAALGVLMANDGLTALMTRAVAAAAQRSRELG